MPDAVRVVAARVEAAFVDAIVAAERTVSEVDGRLDLFDEGADPGRRLDEWLAAARADGASRARSQERFLRRIAPEDATLAGVLLDLAEQGRAVLVTGVGGRRHRGHLRAVGTDVVVLRTLDGRHVVLAHRGVTSVRAEGGVTSGEREVSVAASLADVLAVLAEEAPRVLVVTTAGADGLAGELLSVGRDVAAVRLDGAVGQTAYVPLASVAEVGLV